MYAILGRDGATMLRELFTKINLSTEGFNSIHYVGTRTRKAPTDFRQLKTLVTKLLNDTSVRSPRTPDVIYHALDVSLYVFVGMISYLTICLVSRVKDETVSIYPLNVHVQCCNSRF